MTDKEKIKQLKELLSEGYLLTASAMIQSNGQKRDLNNWRESVRKTLRENDNA